MLALLSKDSAIYFAGRLLPAAAGLGTVVVLVRLLGADGYGQYALVFSIANALAALAGGWLNQAILRFAEPASVPGFAAPGDDALHLALCAALVLTGALAAYGVASLGAGGPMTSAAALLAAALAAAMVVYNAWMTRRQAALLPRHVIAAEGLRGVLSVALPAVAAWLARGAGWVVAATAASYLLTIPLFLGGLHILRGTAIPVEGIAAGIDRRTRLKRDFGYGWPLSAWLGASMMFPVVDRVVISDTLGFAATGAYAAVYDIVVRGLALIFTPIVLAAHPRIMQLANRGDATWRRTLAAALGLQAALFVPVCGAVALGAGWLLPPLLGYSVQQADVLSAVWPLSFAAFLWQIALLVHKPLEIQQRTSRMLIGVLIALLAHVALCRWWVPLHGVGGAAWAYAVGALVYIGLCAPAMLRGDNLPTVTAAEPRA